ncbi:MAG: peptidase M48, partial [SAR324 cluster bacterium]|nr:peptidase M48 [SAR324 cluster bacterium]
MDKKTYFRLQMINFTQSFFLLAGMAIILGLIGWMIAGKEGLLWSVGLGAVTLLIAPCASSELMMKVHKARLLSVADAPGLYKVLAYLASQARIPKIPRLY